MADAESGPAGLSLSAARFTRATDRLVECARFYREIVGLTQLFVFEDHAGYSGFVLGLPDASAQLELVRLDGAPPPAPADPEHAVVLSVRSGFEELRTRLADHGVAEVVPDNPYWVAARAFAVLDPEGWMLIVVPPQAGPGPVRIEEFVGDRAQIAWSFRMAEDSEQMLAGYIGRGRVWVARDDSGAVVGHVQAAPEADESTWEIVNTAVAQPLRGTGVGRRLIEQVVAAATDAGVRRLEVATATADVGNLRFYQRCGFRMTRVVPEVFTAAAGYPEHEMIDGIRLLDQVWFTRLL
ncbi:GNAT family N-acetyltransferase [Nocardia aurantiaca]|uniref:GNAT family N-acetyltransferase n=1 Tax=Nocardia aurantiaca TaxID=2675850 RepID=A0A6I3L7I7_9NOCA|nr:GNAT family N-acetyltransferase [Nocardia aurantiaca]MTE16950.1 GNAT family N-acetyltransferase [Nocardia aurantiaca]